MSNSKSGQPIYRAVLTHGERGGGGGATSIVNSCHKSPSALACRVAHFAIKRPCLNTCTLVKSWLEFINLVH